MIELIAAVPAVALFAQDQTERQVTTLIIVLIVVALLLATLTAWFWHHTDPRRRAFEQAEARREVRQQRPQMRGRSDLRQPGLQAAQEQRLHEDARSMRW